MEQLKILDLAHVFIASYFTDDRQCSHANKEHTLIYLQSGELELAEKGVITRLKAGDCAFIRRDNQVMLQKYASEENPYQSFVLKFSRNFLRDFYHTMDKDIISAQAKRDALSITVLPARRPDIKSLFDSVIPYFDSDIQPSEEVLKLKMTEGIYILLNTDKNLCASLFDFVEPWKIDIPDFMNANYMYDLTLDEIANYTGRSLATFKRDFKKVSELTPQKWLIRKRLDVAHDLIVNQQKKISEVCFDVGFKNLSHFSKLYKQTFGSSPANHIRGGTQTYVELPGKMD